MLKNFHFFYFLQGCLKTYCTRLQNQVKYLRADFARSGFWRKRKKEKKTWAYFSIHFTWDCYACQPKALLKLRKDCTAII